MSTGAGGRIVHPLDAPGPQPLGQEEAWVSSWGLRPLGGRSSSSRDVRAYRLSAIKKETVSVLIIINPITYCML